MIVFCTTCKGRTLHLQKTLPQNLADNANFADCKFLVLDYGDPGELESYLKEHHTESIRSGRVLAYRHENGAAFHVSHAKNMAARCAILEGADVLVTLDADNFTGPNFARYVIENLAPATFLCPDFPRIQALPHGPLRPLRGFAGRLAIRAQDWLKTGGYDETMDTWRGEDIDMISRLQRMGYAMRHIPNHLLQAIPHNAYVRFKEYPHARELYENRRQVRVIESRSETVMNFGQSGVGTVYRNFDLRPIELGPVPTRVFGIGMHKTGTTSLDRAFQVLGFDSLHWGTGEAPLIWQEMNAAGRSRTLEHYYALSDLPIPLLYEKLDAAYPGSKFILTVRNEEKWLKSVEKLWDPKFNATRWVWDAYPFTNRIHTALYGRKDFDADVFLARYRRHNAEVREYFKDRAGDLLVMDIEHGAGWSELCSFLRVSIPAVPYPLENQTVRRTSLGFPHRPPVESNAAYRIWARSEPAY